MIGVIICAVIFLLMAGFCVAWVIVESGYDETM